MRVVGYLRVSTDRQAEEGLGLHIQEASIRAWGEDHGPEIIAMYRDEGISGSNGIDTRIGLADALESLRSRNAEGLVLYRLDRLARDLVLQESLLADLWRIGCQVFSCSPAEGSYLSDDPDDPSRALIRQVLGAVSQYEHSMIAMRLRSGRKRKRESGGFAGGQVPFGYRNKDGVLIEDRREQAAIARMKELQSQGRSLNAIARTLNEEKRRPKKSSRWDPKTVSRVLAR